MIFSSATIHAVTPRYEDGFYWTKTSLKCYVTPDTNTTYGTGVYNAICFGILTWNSTDAPIAILSEDEDSADWDVYVDMQPYGNTGWNARAITFWNETTLIANNATVYINYTGLENYTSDTGLWKAMASHEMGHVYGADHNTTTGEDSILKPVTTQYYNYITGTPNITVPQTPDIACINGIY